MRLRGVHIVLGMLLLAASACGPRIIPRDDMEAIFTDMFLQDQSIRQNHDLRKRADTTLVYEGIFEKYGYDTDDFLRSMPYYLDDPSKMEKIMGRVADRLEKEASVLAKELDVFQWQQQMLRIYGMKPDTLHLPRQRSAVDTLLVRFQKDSVYFVRDTL